MIYYLFFFLLQWREMVEWNTNCLSNIFIFSINLFHLFLNLDDLFLFFFVWTQRKMYCETMKIFVFLVPIAWMDLNQILYDRMFIINIFICWTAIKHTSDIMSVYILNIAFNTYNRWSLPPLLVSIRLTLFFFRFF